MATIMQLIVLISLSEVCAALEDVAVVYGIEGESVSINCTYSLKDNQWREKSWCKHISEQECEHVVSARRFWMPFLRRRNGTTSISDNIQKGLLTVTIKPLQKQDAGLYQCKAEFLGNVNTLCKVKVTVVTGLWETEAPEEPRVGHSISRHVADAGDYLTFLVAGFLSFKFLVAIIVLIIVRCKKNRKTQDESSRENEHQLFPVPGNGWHDYL